MTRWIIAAAVGLLMLCEMLFNVPSLFAQAPGGAFEQLSPGNQKATRALFEAQRSDLPPGTRPLTMDEIASRKQSGQGWGRIFDGMKSRGLVDAKNFGQTVSSFNHRHHISSGGTMTTAANRVRTGHGDQDQPAASPRSAQSVGRGRSTVSTAAGQTHAGSAMGTQTHGQAGGVNGAGHGRGQ